MATESVILNPRQLATIQGARVYFPVGAHFHINSLGAVWKCDEPAPDQPSLTIRITGRRYLLIEGALVNFYRPTELKLLDRGPAFVCGKQYMHPETSRLSPLHNYYWLLQEAYAGPKKDREDRLEEFLHAKAASSLNRFVRQKIENTVREGKLFDAMKLLPALLPPWRDPELQLAA